MDAKDPGKTSGDPSIPTPQTVQPHATSRSDTGTPTTKDANMTDPKRHAGDDDDEEEEGMLKVDEEGQIEDDGADHQVSHSRPTADGRSISLADRLMPLSDASPRKPSGGVPSGSTNHGYVSPRHANLDRERDRDRYLETSPGPSSSYAPQRSRFGYTAEAATSYGPSSAYPYPPNHREPLRPEPFAASSRASFNGPAPRVENRRGWYPPSTTPRGPDTYRPGSIRERERERDWDSFRDGDRDREWSAMDRDRDRDAYRDMIDKRRDWTQRERGAGSSNYDLADSHPPYPASASSKYGFDTRDFTSRRPASPPTHLGREREFDSDRSRDRDRDRPNDRDQRMRTPSSGWGTGMRQWGKPSDAGWDSRSSRRPVSEDARSDTSYRQSGPRSNNTPPAAPSETSGKPIGSDHASERSEVRSRDLSPQPMRSPKGDGALDTASEETSVKEQGSEVEVNDKAQKSADSAQHHQEVKAEKAEDESEGNAQAADVGVVSANGADFSAPKSIDSVKEKEPGSTQTLQTPEVEAQTDSADAKEASTVTEVVSAHQSGDARKFTEPSEPVPSEQQAQRSVDEFAKPTTQHASSPVAIETETLIEQAYSLPPPSKEEGEANSSVADLSWRSREEDTTSQAEAETSSQAVAQAEIAPSAAEEREEVAEIAPAPVSSSAVVGPRSPGHASDSMQATPDEVVQTSGKAENQIEEVAPSQSAATIPEAVKSEATSEAPTIEATAATVDMATASAAPKRSSPEASVIESSNASEFQVEGPAPPKTESRSTDIADVEMVDVVAEQEHLPQVSTDEPESLVTPAGPAPREAERKLGEQNKSNLESVAAAAQPSEPAQLPATEEVFFITATQHIETVATPSDVAETAKPQDRALMGNSEAAQLQATVIAAPTAPAAAVGEIEPIKSQPTVCEDTATEPTRLAVEESESETMETAIKLEEDQTEPSNDMALDGPLEPKQLDESMEVDQPDHQDDQPSNRVIAEDASAVEATSTAVSTLEPPVSGFETVQKVSSQIQVMDPHVTATIDKEKQTHEITLPNINYGDAKEAHALMQPEHARTEEVETPATDQKGPLRIAEIDDPAKEIEPPLMTPTTKEQMDRVILSAVREHIANDLTAQDDWKRILRENQRISQKTTMDVLQAKIYGIPLIVSSNQPLWLEDGHKQTEQVKAQLYSQLLDRKQRLNDKIESLKKRYRSINEEWKLHCSRLDRAAERREMLRRPPVNTPAGTPGGFGAEDASSGAAGGSLLGSSLTTGRANRRSTQAGFAGFGDAVRSEAEFLEILASLENADMQDPNMRAARTTAATPDMYIDPDSDQLLKRRYDDVNGFVADPIAFYLDEFDPDVWSEEEKAIFSRRYALWPKQFGRIAQALPHKTPSQCVRYYYLTKKVASNDFKALAAARNRERKRKTRVKPKKAKGSALMADLKSAKGEEVDDVEDGTGLRSPMDVTDSSLAVAEAPVPSNGRKGGRSRMVPVAHDGVPGSNAEEASMGRKRPADQNESEGNSSEAKASDKKRSGPKSKRAKSDSATGADKARKPRTSLKRDSAVLEEAKPAMPPVPTASHSEPKLDVTDMSTPAGAAPSSGAADGIAISVEGKASVADSDLAAAEALGALAGLFGGPGPGDTNANSTTAGHSSQLPPDSDATSMQQLASELDADGRKPGKKRRSKTAVLGEEGAEATGKSRSKQPTSSYWSVAERYEFLRALVVHGPRWEVVSSTLAQKSTAQARNYFARNEDEVDFADAAALARSHAELPQAEREAAALAFVRQRFASNAAPVVPTLPSAGEALVSAAASLSSFGGDVPPRTTHLPPPPGIAASQSELVDLKLREESPEPPIQRRGLQINSLLNDTNDAASSRTKRRSSLHEWQAEHEEHSRGALGRDASVPPALYARQVPELDRRPNTADHIEATRPSSSDGRSMRDDHDERAKAYERIDSHRSAADGREMRDDAGDSRSWMYDSPYEAHHRPSRSPGYAPMAPPSHPVERGMPASRYSMPPSNVSGAGHMTRPVPSMSSHLHPTEEAEAERERAGYSVYGGSGRSHDSHSMPPAVPGELRHASSGEQLSPTSASFGAAHGYSRYAPPGAASMYPSTAAASTTLASMGRPTTGPLAAPLPSTSERPAYAQRWQRYSQSPGPSVSSTPPSSTGHGASALGGFGTGSAYRLSNSPYSSFPSQSLPRPSLPSLSAGAGKVAAPHLPSLGVAGRSLPPILGSFPVPGRGMGTGPRSAATGEEARYWPYPHRPRGHDQPANRNPE